MTLSRHPHQPLETQIYEADGLWVKQIVVPWAGTVIPQHSHQLSHLSLLAVGSVTVTKDGAFLGKYTAPAGIFIEAGKKHLFVTHADNTVLYCVHELSSPQALKVLEEHQIVV